MKLELVTPPAEEPVSLAEAKLHCRVDHTADDALITRQITAARLWCEAHSGRAIVTQTLRLWLDGLPSKWNCGTYRIWNHGLAIPIPRPKLQSVTSIKYTDAAGVLQTLDPSAYKVDAISEPGCIVPAYATSWPGARVEINSVQVEYVAGWGNAAAVDARVKQALLMLVGHWYENRETVITGTITAKIEDAADALLRQVWHGVLEYPELQLEVS